MRERSTGRFSQHAHLAPDIADFEAPAVTAPDRLSAEILERCPEASSWFLEPPYGRARTVRVCFPSGGSVVLEAHPLDEPDLTSLISAAAHEGGPSLSKDLLAFNAGVREPAYLGPPKAVVEPSWKDRIATSVASDHPDLLALTITTRLYDDGYYWSTSAIGRAAVGKQRDVDLSAYDHLLVEAARGLTLYDYSLVILDLQAIT